MIYEGRVHQLLMAKSATEILQRILLLLRAHRSLNMFLFCQEFVSFLLLPFLDLLVHLKIVLYCIEKLCTPHQALLCNLTIVSFTILCDLIILLLHQFLVLTHLDTETHFRHVCCGKRSLMLFLSFFVEVVQGIICIVTVVEQMPILCLLLSNIAHGSLLFAHEIDRLLGWAKLRIASIVKIELVVLDIALHELCPVARPSERFHSHRGCVHSRTTHVS